MDHSQGGSRILVWEGHWQEVSGTEVPPAGSRAMPRSRTGGKAKPEECYVMRLKKHLRREKTSPYKLTLYDNIIIIIISSTHRFMFPAIFVLKYKTQSAGSRVSEMVHNGSLA